MPARGGETGLKYLTRVDRYVSLKLIELDADYTDRALDPVALLDDGFRRREAQLAANWRLTGKTALEARLSRLSYRYPHFTELDFSGNTGMLAFRWGATAKVLCACVTASGPRVTASPPAYELDARIEERI